jgi:hypothetical protein
MPILLGLVLAAALRPICAQTTPAPTPCPMTPAMRAQMMAAMQDLMVMMQNTAVWTADGLLVLQGNRLIQYGTDLRQRRMVTLPLPAAGATAPSLRSMVPARLIPIEFGGVVLIRGQQVLRMDRTLAVVSSATLPELPAVSASELPAVCPICAQVMTMMMHMHGGMPTATMPAPAPRPAG